MADSGDNVGPRAAPLPAGEEQRLEELRSYGVLDTLPQQAYDDITYLAARICGCPIALMSLIDEERQWFKSRVGLEAGETSRELAFCAHAILEPDRLLVVPDARRDERFAGNPLVISEPSIRFYAGAPLKTSSGQALGTLCVIDRQPRELSRDDRHALAALSRQAMAQLELRRAVAELESRAEERGRYQRLLEEQQRELEQANARLAEENVIDSLTGLYNRRALRQRLEEECRRAKRHSLPLSLALAGVDHFKRYRDEHGHAVGAEVLRRVAKVLQRGRRTTDFVARHVGEEFAVVLGNTPAEGALHLAEAMRRAVEAEDWPHGAITISVGLASLGGGVTGRATLVSAADKALHAAKAEGRNRVVSAGY